MKKNKFLIVFNWILLFSIPVILLNVNVDKEKTTKKLLTKKLSTSLIKTAYEENRNELIIEEEESETIVDTSDDNIEENIIKPDTEIENITKSEEQEIPPTNIVEEKNNDVLTSYTGSMSFYSANCSGCSGLTSTGTDISDGRLYYYDNSYGNVRIIAAGTEIKKWSIVRLKNTSLGDNVLAIVLDRGGAIGEGKTFLIDMLTNSSEKKDGVERNITVEVLRNGK